MTGLVLDTSRHNPIPEPHQLDQIDAWWAKCSQGSTWRDPVFVGHRAAANDAGVPFGGYHFARFNVSAKVQAENIRQAIGSKHLSTLPVMLDLEDYQGDPTGNAHGNVTGLVLELADRVEQLYGQQVVIYAGTYWIGEHLDADAQALAHRPLWVPRYSAGYNVNPDPATLTPPRAPRPWGNWSLWQYTSTGRLPHSPSNYDLSTVPDPAFLAHLKGSPLMVDVNEALRREVAEMRRAVQSDWETQLVDLAEARKETKAVTAKFKALETELDHLRGWLAAIAAPLGVTRDHAIVEDPSTSQQDRDAARKRIALADKAGAAKAASDK